MDDLSGLDWTAKPAANKLPPMNPSYPSLRPTPSPLGSGSNTPLSAQPSAGSNSKLTSTKAPQDSFSNLMNFGLPKANQNLTLAERQAQLEVEKRKKEEARRQQTEAQFGNGQQWDALGSRSFTSSPALQKPTKTSGPSGLDDDDLFAAFNKDTKVDKSSHYPPPESQRSTPANTNQVNLSNPSAWGAPAGANGSNGGNMGGLGVEDDDPFGLNELKPNHSAAAAAYIAPAATDDDDFLGDLARPVEEVRRERQLAAKPEPGKPIEEDSSSDDDEPLERNLERVPQVNKDPFDKAVAQLVDYGFTAEQARRGLVESGTGFNAEAAANWLLDDAHRKAKENAQSARGSQGRDSPAVVAGHQPPPPPRGDNRSPAARGETDLAKSAAAVGSSLFKSANSLWKTGQKKMQQAVSEFQQDGGSSSGSGDPSQPKWMRDAQQAARTQPRSQPVMVEATDEALMLESGGRPQPPRGSSSRQPAEPRPDLHVQRRPPPAMSSESQRRSSPVPRWQQTQLSKIPDPRSRLDRALADDESSSFGYVSANRRRKTPEPMRSEPEPDLLFSSQAPKPSPSPSQPPPQRQIPTTSSTKRSQATPLPTRKLTPQPARQIPPITSVALQTSTTHRLQGTAHFKRGDYASAHSSYTSSLATVPPTHPLMILLLTNRALTALKTGEAKQAVLDAEEALKLVGPGKGNGETVAVKNENGHDEQRDMKDLYGKALSRKAEALEQMEKWADAGNFWQQCVEGGFGGVTAVKGRQRCQDALTPKPKAPPKVAAKPRPRPSATASLAPQKSSEAVTRLREANEAAAREDDEKFALSEKVDARIAAWRDGKRENLRGLIASLDQVLWENSGWKKVGLHELVMVNKVKISYMKAIAKTHPDKLPQDASTEVRLIAGLVFSTLNESWDKFKTDNGL